jgi:hypothetical protein
MSAHKDFCSSLIRFCQQSIVSMVSAGIVPAASYVNFDAHSQFTELPESDLVGTANLHWVNDRFYSVGVSIGISTWQDKNLFKHNDMIDFMHDLVEPTKTIDVVDATTGVKKGWFVVESGVSLMPMLKTDQRSLQFLMVGLQTSLTT